WLQVEDVRTVQALRVGDGLDESPIVVDAKGGRRVSQRIGLPEPQGHAVGHAWPDKGPDLRALVKEVVGKKASIGGHGRERATSRRDRELAQQIAVGAKGTAGGGVEEHTVGVDLTPLDLLAYGDGIVAVVAQDLGPNTS